ncbi:MAG: tRNA (adenosine(37)-N6)-threonylcarbamoyltransferase complex transferase subunit TsaD [Leptospiraceae bacterium]|nr:tRNA (adenosine(37)-N6)-threonylcarbamoyltransferase complex transferase subunit TsaD [Leptospiraceae bacterium]
MLGLGIETSCDETSIGIVEDGKKEIALKVYSQVDLHSSYGGVVPEIASRAHLEKINSILESILNESKVSLKEIEYVAVTAYPGLLGSLIIGAQLARCLSLSLKIPLIALDHLEAHLNVVRLEEKNPKFPYLGVLLSGGNSAIFQVEDFGKMKLIGDTRDDALGEAFDKVATLLNLNYPGGPEIEKLANKYTPDLNESAIFPELLKDLPLGKILFSYSGLKTAVLYYLKKNPNYLSEIEKICYHFQETAFHLVEKNIKRAVALTKIREVVVAGGVAANSTLRKRLQNFSEKINFRLTMPNRKILCTDNGAMVACLGYYLLKKGITSPLDFKVSSVREE